MIPVKYAGTFLDYTGYGSANRAFISSLYVSGANIQTELITNTPKKDVFSWEASLALSLQQRKVPYKIKILHVTPDKYSELLEGGIYHIGHLFWETDRLPAIWVPEINKMNEVWTSSPHMAEVFKASGVVVPVHSFPQPINTLNADINISGFTIKKRTGYMFYAIQQWIERKNIRALLTAYWQEFEGEKNVCFLMKTFRLLYAQNEFLKIRNDVAEWKAASGVKEFPTLMLVRELFTDEAMLRLHKTGDCYVSADRGEGWSRPLQEALLMGKTAVSTARGGIHEYLNDTHYFRVPTTYVPASYDDFSKYYTKDQRWAEVDIPALRKTMRFVFENSKITSAKGLLAQEFIKERFSYHKIGKEMIDRLEKIHRNL